MTLSHRNNTSAPLLPHIPRYHQHDGSGADCIVGWDTNGEDTDTSIARGTIIDGYDADVEDNEDTDTDASQFSIPRYTSMEHDDGYDADVEDSGSVSMPRLGDGYNVESNDGYDADDEDNTTDSL